MHLLQERWAKIKSRLNPTIDVMSLLKSISAIVVVTTNCCTQTIGTTITENFFLGTVGMNEWNPRLHLCLVGRKGGEIRVRSLI